MPAECRTMRKMTAKVKAFDEWIRGSFVEMNTKLEELYFTQEDRADVCVGSVLQLKVPLAETVLL